MIIYVTCGEKRSAYRVDITTAEVGWIVKDLLAKSFQSTYPADHYVLQDPESEEYLSNQNLNMYLRDGVDLFLKLAPAVEAAEAVSFLRSSDDVKKKKTIFSLQKQFQDSSFANEFIRKNGIDVIIDLINKSTGNTVAYALAALQNLMTKDIGWGNLSQDFILKIVDFLTNPTLNICRPAAAILIQMVRAGPRSTGRIRNYGFRVIHEAMKSTNAYLKVVERVNESDVETQMNSLVLINSLFNCADGREKTELMEKLDLLNARKIMMRLMQSTSSAEVSREIINFQVTYHSYLSGKKNIPVSRRNPDHEKLLTEIFQAADVKDPLKLGFKSQDIEHEMQHCGSLGLENMNYFSKKNRDFFSKYILEQNSRADGKSCPFAAASIEVTKLLLEHTRVQIDSDDHQSVLLGFEDLHTFTLQSMFKLWVEMQASASDMPKVVNLMRSHLESIRKGKEPSLDQYKTALNSISYAEVQKKQLQIMEAGDDLLMKDTVRTLKDEIYKDATDFVRNQLVKVLLKGSWFQNYTQKGRGKGYRFYKLSPNKKYLHFAEFPETTTALPSLDQLSEKIDLSNCSDIVMGHLSPLFASKKGKGEDVSLAFSLMSLDAESSVADFVADNAIQYAEWTDGLRVVLGKNLIKNIASESTMGYISTLADVEVKLKMLDIRAENVQIPNDPPEIPPVPSNYDFILP